MSWIPDWDPYDVLQQHEQALNDLIRQHNDNSNFFVSLTQQMQNFDKRLRTIERRQHEILKKLNATK